MKSAAEIQAAIAGMQILRDEAPGFHESQLASAMIDALEWVSGADVDLEIKELFDCAIQKAAERN